MCFDASELFAQGLYLWLLFVFKKTEYTQDKIVLVNDISGIFSPEKKIRGHQLGYRPKNNTYDAWTPEDFFSYFKDMMFFGSNCCELLPGGTDDAPPNELMRWDFQFSAIQIVRKNRWTM